MFLHLHSGRGSRGGGGTGPREEKVVMGPQTPLYPTVGSPEVKDYEQVLTLLID